MMKQRNSSVELLRIIAMLLIISHHAIMFGVRDTNNYPLPVKIIFQDVFFAGGKVGVVIFFSISIWYLCERNITLKDAYRRVWNLEKEVIFYSLFLLVISIFAFKSSVTKRLVMSSILPTSEGLWWYVTSYVVFLMLLPFISVGMRCLSKRQHLYLAIICLFIFGFLRLIPYVKFDMSNNVLGMFYVYILITYLKWHCNSISLKAILTSMFVGLIILLTYTILFTVTKNVYGKGTGMQTYATQDWGLSMVLIGVSLLLLFQRMNFVSKVINYIAASTFGVYLIHLYPTVSSWIWNDIFDLPYNYSEAVVYIAIFALSVFIVSIFIDIIRRFLFKIILNRNPGKYFDRLWDLLEAGVAKCNITYGKNESSKTR